MELGMVLLGDSKRFASEVYLWLGVIIALAFVLGFVALWLRKKLMTPPDHSTPMGFTLKDLRAMHAAGHLSDEELARAEERALARSRSHFLGEPSAQTDLPGEPEEPEDLGHLSTGFEEDSEAGTENSEDSSDKNGDDGPKP